MSAVDGENELSQLLALQELLRDDFKKSIDVPTSKQFLDLESRQSSPKRQFKHIHQMSSFATWGFKVAARMRLLLTIDGFIALHAARCGLLLYGAARSVLEGHGLALRVAERLVEYVGGPASDWKSRGEGFYRYIMRARYGTRDPALVETLIAAGMPKKVLEPIHSRECEAALFEAQEFTSSKEAYAKLCDYVHANSQGYFFGSPGWYVGRYYMTEDGAAGMLPSESPINRYEYPVDNKFIEASDLTMPLVVRHSRGLLSALQQIPRSPYSQEEVMQHTGTAHGAVFIPPRARLSAPFNIQGTQIGRNDLCPCGSGKKYKKCHLSAL
jgi:hypothetical protein